MDRMSIVLFNLLYFFVAFFATYRVLNLCPLKVIMNAKATMLKIGHFILFHISIRVDAKKNLTDVSVIDITYTHTHTNPPNNSLNT